MFLKMRHPLSPKATLITILTVFLQVYFVCSISLSADDANVGGAQDAPANENESVDNGGAAVVDFTLRTCEECDYFLNGCPPPDGIFGVNCPSNGTGTCQLCQNLQGTHKENIRQKRACLHYGNLCSSGICCKNEGLRCQANSEGRGRNHQVCAYN